MASNPLARRRAEPSDDTGARPLIHTSGEFAEDYLATANHHCTRPELEWYRDLQGHLHLGYRAEWSRAHARGIARATEAERRRFNRNLTRHQETTEHGT